MKIIYKPISITPSNLPNTNFLLMNKRGRIRKENESIHKKSSPNKELSVTIIGEINAVIPITPSISKIFDPTKLPIEIPFSLFLIMVFFFYGLL